jgi:hypothetical protein
MKLVNALAIVGLTIVGATAVYAQNADAIKQRREAMRTIAKAGGEPFKMTKGSPVRSCGSSGGTQGRRGECAEIQGDVP